MAEFHVVVIHPQTGQRHRLKVDAFTPEMAEDMALEKGLDVRQVFFPGDELPIIDNESKQTPDDSERAEPVIMPSAAEAFLNKPTPTAAASTTPSKSAGETTTHRATAGAKTHPKPTSPESKGTRPTRSHDVDHSTQATKPEPVAQRPRPTSLQPKQPKQTQPAPAAMPVPKQSESKASPVGHQAESQEVVALEQPLRQPVVNPAQALAGVGSMGWPRPSALAKPSVQVLVTLSVLVRVLAGCGTVLGLTAGVMMGIAAFKLEPTQILLALAPAGVVLLGSLCLGAVMYAFGEVLSGFATLVVDVRRIRQQIGA